MGAHVACSAETVWCAPGPNTSCVQTVVYVRKCQSRMRTTTQINTSCWDFSGGNRRGKCVIPWKQAPLTPLIAVEREFQGPLVSYNLQGVTQATAEGKRLPGVDIARYQVPHRRDNRSSMVIGAEICAAPYLMDQSKPPGGPPTQGNIIRN